MKILLSAANPTNSTILTMELPLLNIIIIEFAYFTEVLPHINTTIRTNSSNWLLRVTDRTDDLFNVKTIEFMTIRGSAHHIRSFVMTMATGVDLITARGSNLTSPTVMLASIAHLPKIKTIIS